MEDRFKYLGENLLPRFWDKDNNEMIYPYFDRVNNWIRYEVIMVDKRYFYPLDWMLFGKNRFIEQKPTGLKDRNGKLIFEGDWIKGEKREGKVLFQKGGFYCYDELLIESLQEDSCEIIGNIYENPELLERII